MISQKSVFYKKIITLTIFVTLILITGEFLLWKLINTKTVVIHSSETNVTHTFEIELARTEREKQTGLMYRDSLAPDHGMLFLYDQDFLPHFWMKNVSIDLDMLFLSADGKIEDIERAVPCEPIGKGECILYTPSRPVRYILEILGGESEKQGIKVGDVVEGIEVFQK